ncbi:hypothetical protein RB195_021089 [Necator americanus]|uniref:Reverse transcriptase domain-containing protein n=1 Tax=Necator americanus TaxID=51031 RepID=A0ABR1EAG1_NECAM
MTQRKTAAARTLAGCTTLLKALTGVREGGSDRILPVLLRHLRHHAKTVDQCLGDTILTPSRCPLTYLENADDVVIFAESSAKHQQIVNLAPKVAAVYGLRLRLDKCKQIYVSSRL